MENVMIMILINMLARFPICIQGLMLSFNGYVEFSQKVIQ
jgi:hypothetical protein